ncbi:MAG: helix-turn-helix domain-containing GNAT family N-acetyltransferase [Maritimibacter sp.]
MSLDPIARIRRFHRAVTTESGVLDSSFLGRGRPLGAARVLNAIGQGIGEVGALRDYLGLDSGLASRLLRGLEGEGLIETVPSKDDARRRIARLTEAGRAEFDAYEALSNDQARQVLEAHPRPDVLLAAMDLVATALGRDRVEIVEADPESPEARHCLTEYFNELKRRLGLAFDLEEVLSDGAEAMRPPEGGFLIAMSDGQPIGCAGLKAQTAEWSEVKRVWVSPAARGLGLARRLMDEVEARAKAQAIPVLRLDTNGGLPEAVALYQRLGWQPVERYNDNPDATHFFEKAL